MTLFTDLRHGLMTYKNSSLSEKQAILNTIASSTSTMAGNRPKTILEAKEMYRFLAYAATIVNYADALRRIDHQEYFDILVDFKMQNLLNASEYEPLKAYFEFHPSAPQMRLLVAPHRIPTDVWALFREAQKTSLRRANKSAMFQLDDLPLDNPPRDEQLYPIQIQMFGRYINYAVDRLAIRADGTLRFASRFGVFLLPGGGMVEVDADLTDNKKTLLCKMLDEHLEEEHANLWRKAVDLFNAINPHEFTALIEQQLPHMSTQIVGDTSNAEKLAHIIHLIDTALATQTDPAIIKTLHENRSHLQTEAIKLTPLYHEAYEYLQANTVMVDIEQFGDTRACGGRQISHCFLTTGPQALEDWFEERIPGGIEPGDDLHGSTIKPMSMMDALIHYNKIKFSHILIALQAQNLFLDSKSNVSEIMWNQDEFVAATASISQGARHVSALLMPAPSSAPGVPAMSSMSIFTAAANTVKRPSDEDRQNPETKQAKTGT